MVSLPAFAEDDDPLGRTPGAALCPERYDEADLARIRQTLGRSFYALYQQNPQPLEGSMFKRSWFGIVKVAARPYGRVVRYWDKAGTADGGTFTVGVAMCRVQGVTYVLDVQRGQWSVGERENTIKQTAYLDLQQYGEDVETWIEQEPGSGGKESARATIRNLAGFTIRADRPTGDKATRAEPYAAQAEAGNVKLIEGKWNGAYLNELASFPVGVFSDQVDASSGSFNKLSRTKKHKSGSVKYA